MTLKNEMFTVVDGDNDNVKIRLNAGHPIFAAHFPGNPIMPGVCQVQMIGELLADRVGRPLTLQEVVNLKFSAPISPVENPELTVGFAAVDDRDGSCKVKGEVAAPDGVKSKFSIIYH